MDIRKTDSKGRLTLGNPGTHYFVTGPLDGKYQLREVPPLDPNVDISGYEAAEVSAAKDEVSEILSEMLLGWGVDEEAAWESADGIWDNWGPLAVAERLVNMLIQKGVDIPEDLGER